MVRKKAQEKVLAEKGEEEETKNVLHARLEAPVGAEERAKGRAKIDKK